MNSPLRISGRVRTLAAQAEDSLVEQFSRIDAIAQTNSQRVLAAFQSHRVAESYFAGTTGYVVVSIDGAAKVNVTASDNARVSVILHGGECQTQATEQARIKTTDKRK